MTSLSDQIRPRKPKGQLKNTMDLSTQYNDIADRFSKEHDTGENSNRDNRKMFYSKIDFPVTGKALLDLACGDGLDLVFYQSLGATVSGIDSSEELIKIARNRLPGADIHLGSFDSTPFPDEAFDAILSKYAIQTSPDLGPVLDEVHRILKPGGVFMYMVTHPFRQYFEKGQMDADYFKQSVVDCWILNATILVKEPSHTMNEYLNAGFLSRFEILDFDEYQDAAAEQVDGRTYPGYFILKARKRA
jgi:ubiquinone/menaquinone biosynthesis C-methylase UbiE